jgi:hypothetical protein
LGERLNRTQEVIGSIPFSSTKIDIHERGRKAAFLCSMTLADVATAVRAAGVTMLDSA